VRKRFTKETFKTQKKSHKRRLAKEPCQSALQKSLPKRAFEKSPTKQPYKTAAQNGPKLVGPHKKGALFVERPFLWGVLGSFFVGPH